jgi:hypothetical protein
LAHQLEDESMNHLFARALAAASLLCGLLGMQALAADGGARPPCGVAPLPPFAEPGMPPNVRAWSGKAAREWLPAACTGWTTAGFDVVVALAGSFRFDGEVEDLLGRIGAVSELKGIRYWSTTEKAWHPLVTEAFALNGPDVDQKRPDFPGAQLANGQKAFFAQADNRSSGKTVYRLRVVALDRDRLVVETENVTAVKMAILTMFGAGDLQSLYYLERRASGVWGYYNLSRTRAASSMLPSASEASYINRAVAYYRHFAGIPTDQEPPAAR